jgi:hypothetical protein
MYALAKRKSHRSMGWINLGIWVGQSKATRSGGFEFKRLIPVALWVCQKAAAKTEKLMAKS